MGRLDETLDGCSIVLADQEVTPDEEIDALCAGIGVNPDPELADHELTELATAMAAMDTASFPGGRDLGLANRLRRAGLKVKEVDGWQTRGDPTFSGRGAVCHHTAGARTGLAPSLGICINGRSDLRGPLCNIFMDREGTIYVVASGKANHAGLGDWKGITGNSHVWGLEIEHPGTFPLDAKRVRLAARALAACIWTTTDQSNVCQHWEWSTQGKIDTATNFRASGGPWPTAGQFRRLVGTELARLKTDTQWQLVARKVKGKPELGLVAKSEWIHTPREGERFDTFYKRVNGKVENLARAGRRPQFKRVLRKHD